MLVRGDLSGCKLERGPLRVQGSGACSGGVDQLAVVAFEIQPDGEVVPGRACNVGNQCRGCVRGAVLLHERIEEATLAGIGRADEDHPKCRSPVLSLRQLRERLCDDVLACREATVKVSGGDELDVLFDKVQPGFQLSQDIDQFVTNSVQGPAQSARQLAKRGLKLIGRSGLDDAQDSLGLSQVQPASEEGPHRKLAWLGKSGAISADRPQQGIQQGRRAERV
jgi:hypothetical protein